MHGQSFKILAVISHMTTARDREPEITVNWRRGRKLEEQLEDETDYSRFCWQVHQPFATLRDLP